MVRKPGTPTRLSPADILAIERGAARVVTYVGSDNLDSNYASTSSFTYSHPEDGLKSTQQLKVDWSSFENHTFFSSATAKVNVAFDRIINGYPFDGTKRELEKFLDDLTGYERYVLSRFHQNVGYLFFSGSYISVADYQGSTFPALSKNTSGQSVLDPSDGPYTVEFHLYLPPESAGAQVAVQRQANNVGVCAYVKSGSSASTAEVAYAVFSGSYGMVASASVTRNQFHHIAGVYDRDGSATAQLYVDGAIVGTSANSLQLASLSQGNVAMLVGTGSSFTVGSLSVTPNKLLSGALDELRVFNTARTVDQLQRGSTRNLFAQDGMLLCYRFNEPSGTLSGGTSTSVDSVVLDSSGNGLHTFVTNYAASLRATGSIGSPLSNERLDLNPVLFPGFANVSALNADLLSSGSAYDQDNPNLITKLVPRHYLTDGQDYEGMSTVDGQIDNAYGGSSVPGAGVLGSTQLLLALLYTWAKYFDELKLFIASFATLKYVDYDSADTSPDVFLPFALKELGVNMPNLFSDAAFAQYNDGEDVEPSFSLNDATLQSVQNSIMRRVLTNVGDIIRSKGTLHSVEAFFRAIGIDPNSSFKIKERGGAHARTLGSARETRQEPMQFLDFSGGGLLVSPFLSSSRVEPGVPGASGFVSGALSGSSAVTSDGLWTSGSWTLEGRCLFPPSVQHAQSQSLCRLAVTGTASPTQTILLNLIAVSRSSAAADDAHLVLYARPGNGTSLSTSPLLTASLPINVFDGDDWYYSVGRWRNDLTASAVGISLLSASYFLRAGKQSYGALSVYSESVAYSVESSGADSTLWSTLTSTANASGSFLKFGSASVAAGSRGLNDTSLVPAEARVTALDGRLSRIRFWSKALEASEWQEHVRNPNSTGVRFPDYNFNFNTTISGSWERLRIDASAQQAATGSDNGGGVQLFDYSQNAAHLTGSSFPATSSLFPVSLVGYSYVSPQIDEATTSEKVRVRGYLDFNKVSATPWAQVAPVHEVPRNEEPQDDPRVSIEFSLVDALNRDIVTMMGTLESLDEALGAVQNEFSSDYQNLEHLRQVYFHRMTDKLNFRAFFDFFRWIDSSVSTFVEHLMPRKSSFQGVEFVVEPHLLERAKKEYHHWDMYLGEADKPTISDKILLEQVVGVVNKF